MADDGRGHASSHHVERAAGTCDAPPPLPSSPSSRKRGRPRGSCNKAKLAAAAAAADAGRAAVAASIDSLLSVTATTATATADGVASRREQLLRLVEDSIVSGGNHLAASPWRQPRRCSSSPAVHEQYDASPATEEQHGLSFSRLTPGVMIPPRSDTTAMVHASAASASAGPALQRWYGSAPGRSEPLQLGSIPDSVGNIESGGQPPLRWTSGHSSLLMPFADGTYCDGLTSVHHVAPQLLLPADGLFRDAQPAADDGPRDGHDLYLEEPLWASGFALSHVPTLAQTATDVAAGGNGNVMHGASPFFSEDQQPQGQLLGPGYIGIGPGFSGTDGSFSHLAGPHFSAGAGGPLSCPLPFPQQPTATPQLQQWPAASLQLCRPPAASSQLRKPRAATLQLSHQPAASLQLHHQPTDFSQPPARQPPPHQQSGGDAWVPQPQWMPFCPPPSAAVLLGGCEGGLASLDGGGGEVSAALIDSRARRGMSAPALLRTMASTSAAWQQLPPPQNPQEPSLPARAPVLSYHHEAAFLTITRRTAGQYSY